MKYHSNWFFRYCWYIPLRDSDGWLLLLFCPTSFLYWLLMFYKRRQERRLGLGIQVSHCLNVLSSFYRSRKVLLWPFRWASSRLMTILVLRIKASHFNWLARNRQRSLIGSILCTWSLIYRLLFRLLFDLRKCFWFYRDFLPGRPTLLIVRLLVGNLRR